MDQQYVDEFFDSGRLQLSAFAQFAKHTDEQRLDRSEGSNVLVGQSQDQTIMAVTKHGGQSYVLCASMIESPEIASAFGCTGAFRIKDSTSFGCSIAAVLPRFTEGLEGPCSYQERRWIQRTTPPLDLGKLNGAPDGLNTMAAHVFGIGGPDVFFIKHSQFRAQAEYRFIWNVSADVVEPIVVECPEARNFCERVT